MEGLGLKPSISMEGFSPGMEGMEGFLFLHARPIDLFYINEKTFQTLHSPGETFHKPSIAWKVNPPWRNLVVRRKYQERPKNTDLDVGSILTIKPPRPLDFFSSSHKLYFTSNKEDTSTMKIPMTGLGTCWNIA